MSGYRIVWEDEGKAREVELYVDYTVQTGTVQIDAIRPTRVTFYDAVTKTAVRSIGVHTATARRMLTDAYLAARAVEQSLEAEIYGQLAARDGVLPQAAC